MRQRIKRFHSTSSAEFRFEEIKSFYVTFKQTEIPKKNQKKNLLTSSINAELIHSGCLRVIKELKTEAVNMKNSWLYSAVVNMASLLVLQLNGTSVNTGWL